MDVGPMLEDADGGAPPAERTVIGAAFGFGATGTAVPMGTTVDDRSLEVTATHPPMATEGQEEVGFFEGDLGDAPDVAEVPPDAGAQVGLPELDEPLVDDFEGPAPEPAALGPDLGVTPDQGTPAAVDGFGALDDAFVFAQTMQAEALPEEQNRTLAGEPMPELMIDEGLLDTTGSDEVTARQSPLPPAPDAADAPDDDQPRKGFFRKLFGNK